MTARRPWRRCPAPGCAGSCAWVDPAWVCRKCGAEWVLTDGEQFAPPGGPPVDLATCSYGELRPHHGVGVRISLGTPRWIKRTDPWPYVPELAPHRSYLNTPDETEFVDKYLAQLRAVGVARIRQQLVAIAAKHPGQRLVLLCFEKLSKGEPCHRRYFASWWHTTTGQQVPELGEVPTHEQLAMPLFDDDQGGS